MSDQQAIAAAFALTRRAEFVYVTTNGDGGYPETRVMFNLLKMRNKAVARGPAQLPDGFASWLGTNTSSRKVAQVRRDPRVCLYYSDLSTFEGITLSGRLEEVHDGAVKGALWMKSWDMYYKGGIDGGDFTVLHFVPERGRYYHGLRVVEFDASLPLEKSGSRAGGRRAPR